MLGTAELIGIDIGQYAIKLARVKKTGKSFACNFLAYEDIPAEMRGKKDHNSLKRLVGDLVKRHKLANSQPVIHIAAGDALMRRVNVPGGLSGDELEGAIELDLAPALPFSIDQVYFDFEETPDENGSYLAIAARRDLVDPRTDLLQDRGKRALPVQVDVDIFAYERLIAQLQGAGVAKEKSLMIVDIGYNMCRLIAFKNQKYVFHREQQIGGQQATEMFADAYECDNQRAEKKKLDHSLGDDYPDLILKPYANALVEQINLAIDFYEASGPDAVPVEKLYLTGGGAKLKGLSGVLQKSVTIAVSPLDLSARIKPQNKKTEIFQKGFNHALAIGLAMEGSK